MRYLHYYTFLFLVMVSFRAFGGGNHPARAALVNHIAAYYPEQLTNPQKKNRITMSQFGYNLSYFSINVFPITSFINLDDFGIHSYAQPGRKEKNGSLYSCRGGFIDFTHLRAAIDWTVYLTFTILSDQQEIKLTPEAGDLKLYFKNTESLSTLDIVEMSQRIAFERLEWHEAASWHYHRPYHFRSDQLSAFTPEDTYSNFLGTAIGKQVALRILNNLETRSYAEIVTEEINEAIKALEPVASKKLCKKAYDIVDRHKQLQLPADKRNNDVWWDSSILFRDQRYVFKRDIDMGPEIDPWLVPLANELGCPDEQSPEIFTIPSIAGSGISFDSYYDFTITPDTSMFYGKGHKQVHTPFTEFNTRNFNSVVRIIA
ncbi:MAG: DUF4056 domain-containing protein, partial [Bacteroidota bacterium]